MNHMLLVTLDSNITDLNRECKFLGDTVAFTNFARVWRLFLEEIRNVVNGQDKPGEQIRAPDC
jgi:hypothetical protein